MGEPAAPFSWVYSHGMRNAGLNAYWAFTDSFEGWLDYPYGDFHHDPDGKVTPLVTTGRGNLIDPISEMINLPWYHRLTRLPASKGEITDAFLHVKAAVSLARLGGRAFEQLTDLRLSKEAINDLCTKKLLANEAFLRNRRAFSKYDEWCCDGQILTMSMCWAMGSGFKFPTLESEIMGEGFHPDFEGHFSGRDWQKLAGEVGDASADPSLRGSCWMMNNGKPGPNPLNPGIHQRNLANRLLAFNANEVEMNGLDPDILYWPADIRPY